MKRFKQDFKERISPRHIYSIKYCGNMEKKQILDIGCSFGWFEYLANAKKIIGIDPVNDMKNKIIKKNVKFKQMGIFDIHKIPDKFDIVVMFEVLEHIKESEFKVFKKIHASLKKGGKLILSTPNSTIFSNFLDPAWYFGHKHYNTNRLTKIIKKAGYSIENVTIKGGFAELIGIISMYFFKHVFKIEDPFKKIFMRFRHEEYFKKSKNSGFATIFITARKNE